MSDSAATSPSRHVRVLIADDHPIVRASVRSLVESAPTISVVAEAEDGEEALTKIAQFVPDVALVDVAMPKLSGIEVVRRVATSAHRTRILALTALDDPRYVRESLAAGAAGFVPKNAAAAELIAAIHAVATGGRYIHPRSVDDLTDTARSTRPLECQLSIRETEVLQFIARGYANKEIAAKLDVSVKTVETYKARAMEKISAKSRVDIVRFAVAKGWLNNSSQRGTPNPG